MSCEFTNGASTSLEREGARWAHHLAAGCADCATLLTKRLEATKASPEPVPNSTPSFENQSDSSIALTVLEEFQRISRGSDTGERSQSLLLPAANSRLEEAFELRFSSLRLYEGKIIEAKELAESFRPTNDFEARLRNDTLARVSLQMANYCRLSCQIDASKEHLLRAEDLADSGFENPETSWALLHFTADLLDAQAEETDALKALHAARRIAQDAGLSRLATFSEAMYLARESEGADRYAREEVVRLEQILQRDLSDPIATAVISINRALALAKVGSSHEVVDAALEQAAPSKEATPYLYIAFLIASCRIQVDRKRSAEAAHLAEEAVLLAAETGHPRYFVESLLALAEVMAQGQSWPEAARVSAEGARLAAEMNLTALFEEAVQLFLQAMSTGSVDPELRAGLRSLLS